MRPRFQASLERLRKLCETGLITFEEFPIGRQCLILQGFKLGFEVRASSNRPDDQFSESRVLCFLSFFTRVFNGRHKNPLNKCGKFAGAVDSIKVVLTRNQNTAVGVGCFIGAKSLGLVILGPWVRKVWKLLAECLKDRGKLPSFRPSLVRLEEAPKFLHAEALTEMSHYPNSCVYVEYGLCGNHQLILPDIG